MDSRSTSPADSIAKKGNLLSAEISRAQDMGLHVDPRFVTLVANAELIGLRKIASPGKEESEKLEKEIGNATHEIKGLCAAHLAAQPNSQARNWDLKSPRSREKKRLVA